MSLWEVFLKKPLANLLFFLYQATGSNLGFSIFLISGIIGLAMIPLMLPSMGSAQKMQQLKPELDKLSKKFKGNKQALAAAQMDLYKKHNINPVSGIFPMIIRLLVVIALYQVLNFVTKVDSSIVEINTLLYPIIKLPESLTLNTKFLYLDITQPDLIKLPFELNLLFFKTTAIPGLFLILSALAQYFSVSINAPKKEKKAIKEKTNNPSQPNSMEGMQKQMAIIGPAMTLLIGFRLPSGLIISWFTFSLITIFQQSYLKKYQNKQKESLVVKKTIKKESKFL